MAKQIGIYSGSFDPVHEGHISFAKETAVTCGLDTIIFMPERFPRGKPHVTPISERLTELEIALASTPFKVLNAHSDQFTVDETLTELETLYLDTDFTFLIGSDVALNLPRWKNLERLTSRYSIAVGMRRGETKKAVEDVLRTLHIQRYFFVTTPHAHISSSSLRNPR